MKSRNTPSVHSVWADIVSHYHNQAPYTWDLKEERPDWAQPVGGRGPRGGLQCEVCWAVVRWGVMLEGHGGARLLTSQWSGSRDRGTDRQMGQGEISSKDTPSNPTSSNQASLPTVP